jgi:predicted metal-dependent hydrolase
VWTETRESGERILCVAGGAEHIERRVHDYLKREVRRDLHKSAQYYAEALNVRVRRLSIRDQSSRWGSCTSAGSLSFSWRLILAPPYVLDYLAAHEVAHLVEMNHSPRFWKVVARVCGHVERAKTWLDTSGNDLHRYGIQD